MLYFLFVFDIYKVILTAIILMYFLLYYLSYSDSVPSGLHPLKLFWKFSNEYKEM